METSPETAHTEIRKGPAAAFVVACVLTFVAVPAAQVLVPSKSGDGVANSPVADFFNALAELPETVQRESGSAFFVANRLLKARLDELEKRLEQESLLMVLARPAVQWGLAAAGGAGNERVYLGRGDWLLLREGFDYVVGPPFLDPDVLERRRLDAPSWLPPPEPDPRPAVFDFHRRLAERGIRLLVMPVPAKPMIHPEILAPALAADSPRLHNPSFEAFRQELEERGIMVYDPSETLRGVREEAETFLRTDSHWSPEGLDAAARGLADRLQSLGIPWSDSPVSWRTSRTRLEGEGDLARALRLPAWWPLYPPQEVEISRVLSSRRRPWRPDPRAEVLLLGDSFSNVYSEADLGWGRAAGLGEQLSYYLKRPVDRIAVNDGGDAGTRARLALEMAEGRDRLQGKKVVVLQFAVRELAVGDWRVVEF